MDSNNDTGSQTSGNNTNMNPVNPTMQSEMDVSPLPKERTQNAGTIPSSQSGQAQEVTSQNLQNQNQPPTGLGAQSTPPPPPNAGAQTLVTKSKGGSGFKIFVVISILIILGVWGVVFYLYTQNQKLKQQAPAETTVEDGEEVVLPSPTPEFSPDQVEVENGNIVRKVPGQEANIIVDKENYESTGITGFVKVSVSADNSKICFESWPPAPEPALYISDIDGQGIIEVSPNRKNCIWDPDSSKIYYVNYSMSSTPQSIFYYDISKEEEKDLTKFSVPEGVVRRYDIVGLSSDKTKLICKFEDVGETSDDETSNPCEIDLKTYEVENL